MASRVIMLLGFYEHRMIWPRKTELQGTARGFHIYGSSPEAGSPRLPFVDNSVRRSDQEPRFDTGYEEDEEY